MNGVRQRGVALAIVVWFIAGMSLLVAGIVSHARVDTRMAQLHVARAKAAAAGDGAIQLLLAEMVSGRLDTAATLGRGWLGSRYRLGELEVTVRLQPAAGLIDLNHASAEVLAALFAVAAGMAPGEAKNVADNVVKWRATKAASAGRGGRKPKTISAPKRSFAAIEDVLRVDGVSRSLLDAVRDYVTAGMPSQRGTNWALSSDVVLAVLERANPQQLQAVLQKRERAAAKRPDTADDAPGRASLSVGSFRADAVVRYGEQRWLRRRWLSTGTGAKESMLPWKMVRTEAPRVVQQSIQQ